MVKLQTRHFAILQLDAGIPRPSFSTARISTWNSDAIRESETWLRLCGRGLNKAALSGLNYLHGDRTGVSSSRTHPGHLGGGRRLPGKDRVQGYALGDGRHR